MRLTFWCVLLVACAVQCARAAEDVVSDLDGTDASPSAATVDAASSTAADAEEPTVAPARNPALLRFEDESLGSASTETTPAPKSNDPPSPGEAVVSIIGYMAALFALLWGGVLAFRKFAPGAGRRFNSPAIEELGRTYLDSRRYLSVVRFGRRLLLMGVSGDAVSAVCEVDDPEEVAELLTQARPASSTGKSVFRQVLEGVLRERRADAETTEAEGDSARFDREMSGIEERLRRMRAREEQGSASS